MRKTTKLEDHLIRAGMKDNKQCAEFLGVSISTFSKMRAGHYNPNQRAKEFMVFILNKKLNLKGQSRLTIADVFPE